MKKFLFVLMSAAVTFSIVGCSGANTQTTKAENGETTAAAADETAEETGGDTIRFAVVGAMTGDSANTGIQQEWGVRLAVEEINAAGGIDGKMLEYEVFDDQLLPDQAVICAEKIVADGGFDFVLSPISSGCTLASYPVYDAAGIPVLSATNTSDQLTEQGFENFVRICPTAGANLVQLVDLAVNEFGVKAPAIVYTTFEVDTGSYESCVELLKERGIEVVSAAAVEADTEKDYNSYIVNFKDAGADAIFCFSEYAPSALFVKQQYALGYDIQQFSLSGTANQQFVEIAGADAAEGFISMSAFDASNPKENIQSFVEKYTELSGLVPGEWGAGGYDTVYVAAEALKGGATRENMVQWLKDNCNYEGVTGTITFDEKGDNPSAKAVILMVRDGEFTVYE